MRKMLLGGLAALLLVGQPALAARYALVDGEGNVVNVVEWDGAATFPVPAGQSLVAVGSSAAGPGWIYADGEFSNPVSPPAPSIADQYAEKLAAGIAITSTGTPSLNATYPIDDKTAILISGLYAGIKGGDGVPGGGSDFVFTDIGNAPHTFTADDFTALAKAIRDYRYALVATKLTLLNNGSADWPAASATIP